uniref:PPM-type phosphatase domain-containing protein n=1 Tax=Octactis speculum TaxID=3111310 RepID=A0A7S2AVR4_9STRA|mmetsp:Transcript_16245/g.21886  ORF Transcript_16245/g.21886 Transcript_16245/m.21886 type:complete len:207 (+) Transcript_16245:376-996(+)
MVTSAGFLIVANVGDSRATLCCAVGKPEDASAVDLSVDHTAMNALEAKRIIDLGGFIETSGEVHRVMGKVAVTRSIGNRPLKRYLSASPHTVILNLSHTEAMGTQVEFRFLVLATDGLWDVMSSEEAVAFVLNRLKHSEAIGKEGDSDSYSDSEGVRMGFWQQAATALTHEALVRGSSDNIGVCVINLQSRLPAQQKTTTATTETA